MNRILRFIRYGIIGLTALLLAAVICFYLMMSWLTSTVVIPEEHRVVTIPKGQSLYALASSLSEKGLVTSPKLWVYYARFIDNTKIKAGEFELGAEESPLSLLTIFSSSDVIQYKLTFIEGSRAKDALSVLAKQAKLEQKLPETIDIAEPVIQGLDVEHLEGWLYPDTYYYSAGDSDLEIVQRSHAKMQQVLQEEWQNRQEGLPLENAYEALILASIVEKETGAPHEREQIAGVFIRRLNLGMRLQTDPTVIYGMGDSYDGNITRADLRTPTAYNTYTISGLPPTPIALAGREAIRAVLNPADGESLYFVAKGDGTHYFSSSLDEHINAVKKFQLNRKENYRSNFKSSE